MKKPIITVMVKHPGHPPFMVSCLNELKTFQSLVDGMIEVLPVAQNLLIMCNEEGKILDLPYNCTLVGEPLMGTIVFVGVEGEEFDSVPLSMEQARQLFPEMWEEAASC
jgi:hypothetical protein